MRATKNKSQQLLLADSGSTKTTWCLLSGSQKKIIYTEGISPYFMEEQEIVSLLQSALVPALKKNKIDRIVFYGTGCSNKVNSNKVKKALQLVFQSHCPDISIYHDLMGAAHALCGQEPGIACILGTGSNSCYYDGKKIKRNSPGLGYVLGDEGSGAYLGKIVLQHYLYQTFDQELMQRFDRQFETDKDEILNRVYRQPLANRYLAGFAKFLAENRGHYMIENMIEDGLNDFFFTHLTQYPQSRKLPIHFTGSIADAFKDTIQALCKQYGFTCGHILKEPMDGLIRFYRNSFNI
ncbi:MAG: N-acetylglucosamine kinase [Bacteroidetes bacterium]|nr:N-acetylglucosamine kinase [Bacteroidota bacterium]